MAIEMVNKRERGREGERERERERERKNVLIAYYNRWSADAGL